MIKTGKRNKLKAQTITGVSSTIKFLFLAFFLIFSFNFISASSFGYNNLDNQFILQGGDTVKGNYNFIGNINITNLNTINISSLNVNSSLLPANGFDNQFDIGNTSLRWKSLRIGTGDSSFAGKVGINTTSPSYLLQVSGTGVNAPGPGILINNTANTQNAGWRIVEGQPGNYDGYLMIMRASQNTPGDLYITSSGQLGTSNSINVLDGKTFGSASSGAIAFYEPYSGTSTGEARLRFRSYSAGSYNGKFIVDAYSYYGGLHSENFYTLFTSTSSFNPKIEFYQNTSFSGNVLIGQSLGSTSPQNKLNVIGAVNATQFIVNASVGYSGYCVNVTYLGGIAVSCND